METTIKQRLIEYLRYVKMGQNKFEKLSGLSNGYISNLKSSPSPEKIKKILDFASDINSDWLLYGEGPMLRDGGHSSEANSCDTTNEIQEMKAKISELEHTVTELKARIEEKDAVINNLLDRISRNPFASASPASCPNAVS